MESNLGLLVVLVAADGGEAEARLRGGGAADGREEEFLQVSRKPIFAQTQVSRQPAALIQRQRRKQSSVSQRDVNTPV